MIAEHVEPAAKTVATRLQSFEKFLDERKMQYDSDLAAFRAELDTLKKRNALTHLADRAIGDGSLDDYESLLRMLQEEVDPDLKAAANAEVYRVMDAYGLLSPPRVMTVTLNASAINPKRKNESELTGEELVVALSARESLGRARAAFLLESHSPTFHLAESVKDALENEKHLEALRYEKRAFSHFTGFNAGDAIDASKELKWWPENVDRLRKDLPK